MSRLTSQDVSIKSLPTKKDKIRQPELAKKENGMVIPPLGSSVLISGKSGSGKSTLLANLMLDKRFYKGWFDKIFLFSPTANGDDIQKQLNIPAKHVFTDLEEAPELLEVILRSQKESLENTTADKAKQYAIIFDDVIGDTRFMNTKEFTQCFYQVRHVCCTTFICTQHFTRVPRICRLQANFIMYFAGSMSETEILVEEFSPPSMSKNAFRQLVVDATSGAYEFLTINMKVGWDTRFRKNLGELLSTGQENSAPEKKSEKEHADLREQQATRGRIEFEKGQQPAPGSRR
jgi:ABC-type dipeptide/oligopeptide/nickel transport system ATPase subunit